MMIFLLVGFLHTKKRSSINFFLEMWKSEVVVLRMQCFNSFFPNPKHVLWGAKECHYAFLFSLIVPVSVQRRNMVSVTPVLKQFNTNVYLGHETFKDLGVSSVNTSHVAIFTRIF